MSARKKRTYAEINERAFEALAKPGATLPGPGLSPDQKARELAELKAATARGLGAHTPGPWIWGEEGKSIYATVNGTERRIASVVTIRDFHPDDTRGPTPAEHALRIANADLIEAAPDLLDAAEQIAAAELRSAHGEPGGWIKALAQLRAAIAKARGGK